MCLHTPFAITPETDTSCHYFVAASSNYGTAPSDEEWKTENQFLWDVLLTDKAAIEWIQQSYLDMGSKTPDVSVRADEAALRFRRMLEQQLLRESESAAAKPSR
ncbi:hypothetical protein [Cupriavidus necator]